MEDDSETTHDAGAILVETEAPQLKLGIGLFGTEPAQRMVELVKLAEDLGCDNVWVGDSQNLWREAYTTLAAAAMQTKRIVLGTGVTNATTRHISVLASSWASLHELSGGRVACGIGVGDSSLFTMGMVRPSLRTFEERIMTLRDLLAGRAVKDADTGAEFHLQFANDVRVPVYVAAAGPRALEMAGRIGDGAIIPVGTDPRLISAAIERIDAGARSVGRSIDDIDVVLWTAISVGDDGRAARDVVRSYVASVVNHAPLVQDLGSDEMALIERIRTVYRYERHMDTVADHRELVPDALADMFAISGTVDECRAQLRTIAGTGVQQVAGIPFAIPEEARSEVITRFVQEVARPILDERRDAEGSVPA